MIKINDKGLRDKKIESNLWLALEQTCESRGLEIYSWKAYDGDRMWAIRTKATRGFLKEHKNICDFSIGSAIDVPEPYLSLYVWQDCLGNRGLVEELAKEIEKKTGGIIYVYIG